MEKKMLTWTTLVLALILPVVLIGCRAVGADAEAKLGITAKELRAKSLAAVNGDGTLAGAKSFETRYAVLDSSVNLVGALRERRYIEMTRYLAPDNLSIGEIYSPEHVKRMIVNPRGIWQISVSGKVDCITSESRQEAIRFTTDLSNPAKTDADMWRLIELQESDYKPELYYQLVYYPVKRVIRKQIEYIDKTTFLPVRTIIDFDGDRQVITDIVEYRKFDTLQMPYRTLTRDNKSKSVTARKLQLLKVNCLDENCICDFEPNASLDMSVAGCKACGVAPKARKYYEPTKSE